MTSLKDVMVDTSFVEEFLAYLQKEHEISAWVESGSGTFVPLEGTEISTLPHTRFYPFESGNEFGGIRCAAESMEALQRAEPHILLGIKGIDNLLFRDVDLLQTSEEMLQLSGQMNFLFKFARKALGVSRIDVLCRLILKEIAPSIQADFGIVHIENHGGKKIDILYNIKRDELTELRAKGLDTITSQNVTVISNLDDDTSLLFCPIKDNNGLVGYLAFFKSAYKRFFSSEDKRVFSSYEKKFVMIIEHIISPIVESIRLYGSLQELYLNTVRTLAAAIDAKDQYTHGHSSRVAWFSKAIGKQLGFSDTELHDLDIAAYMHDLGKIGISEYILGKPGKLTPEEFLEIKKHPLLTHKILEPIRLSSTIVDAAVQHHERMNGSGYPFGLKGEQISPLARVITAADVFDALTSKRPYRDYMTVEKALGMICDDVDSVFDRQVVQALLRAVESMEINKDQSPDAPELHYADFNLFKRFLDDMLRRIRQSPTAETQAEETRTNASSA
ncbi:MAG: HD-GYP domain-containing protein [Syntrophorhabdaceae bacterium]|nr:HD-GYP domain-containing protein [Syntrophorhabdaceae bacterium]